MHVFVCIGLTDSTISQFGFINTTDINYYDSSMYYRQCHTPLMWTVQAISRAYPLLKQVAKKPVPTDELSAHTAWEDNSEVAIEYSFLTFRLAFTWWCWFDHQYESTKVGTVLLRFQAFVSLPQRPLQENITWWGSNQLLFLLIFFSQNKKNIYERSYPFNALSCYCGQKALTILIWSVSIILGYFQGCMICDGSTLLPTPHKELLV